MITFPLRWPLGLRMDHGMTQNRDPAAGSAVWANAP
jgi:hypothetical protein